MNDNKFLKFLDKFKNVYTKLGVDYEKMRLILAVKLALDSRRTSSMVQNNTNDKKNENKDNFKIALIMYAIMGLFIGILVLFNKNNMFIYAMSFGIFMFFILTIFISDFSNVLLDLRDKEIIGTRGVDNKTINAAKITHICYYILLTSLALGWLTIIGMFKFGIVQGILFLIELIVVDILMIVITALLYLLILRFFDGEKVKDIINFVQIGLTIVMVLGYQLLGQMFNIVDVEIQFTTSIWNLFLPPMWFAAPIYAVSGGKIDGIIVTLIILAIVVPILAFILYLKNTAKFEESLYKLNLAKNSEKQKRKGLLYKLGYSLCKSSEEKASYDLANSIMKREREFKLMAYPTFSYLMIFPILFIFIFSRNMEVKFTELPLNMSLNIYWFVFMIPTILMLLQYSKNYKAAWIFQSAYIKDVSNIFRGTYKALIVNILLPIYIFESIVFIAIFKFKVIPNLIIAFIFMLMYISISHILIKNEVPFTLKSGVVDKSRNLIIVFVGFAMIGAGVGVNLLVSFNTIATIAYGIILAGVAWMLWKKCIKAPKELVIE